MNREIHSIILIFTVSKFLEMNLVETAPPAKRPQIGPCIGMDCLHGILMHNDEKQGNDHEKEDTEVVNKQSEEFKGKQAGPCEGLDCLHGVLMHGDGEQGENHSGEDKKKTEEYLKQTDIPSVESPDSVLHQDGDTHNEQESELGKNKTYNYNVDQELMLHESSGDGDVHMENRLDKKTGVEVLPPEANRSLRKGGPLFDENMLMDLEKLLHGGENYHKHDEEIVSDDLGEPRDPPEAKVPDENDPRNTALTLDLEQILHGGEGHDHHKAGSTKGPGDDLPIQALDAKAPPKRHPKDTASTLDLEQLLHGDAHGHENTMPSGKKQSGIPTVQDADRFLHTDSQSDTNLHFQKKEDTGWNLLTGWTIPFISDTVLSNTDLLKKRYLPKFWNEDTEPDEVDHRLVQGQSTGSEPIDLDMRHELENIGNSGPINVKQKIHEDLEKIHKKKHDES